MLSTNMNFQADAAEEKPGLAGCPRCRLGIDAWTAINLRTEGEKRAAKRRTISFLLEWREAGIES